MRAITFDGNIVSEAKDIADASTTSENIVTSRKKQDRSYAGNLYSSQINSLRNMVNGCRGKVEEEDTRERATRSPHNYLKLGATGSADLESPLHT